MRNQTVRGERETRRLCLNVKKNRSLGLRTPCQRVTLLIFRDLQRTLNKLSPDLSLLKVPKPRANFEFPCWFSHGHMPASSWNWTWKYLYWNNIQKGASVRFLIKQEPRKTPHPRRLPHLLFSSFLYLILRKFLGWQESVICKTLCKTYQP